MFIQGNLQNVFDALFVMGIIDPALKADWSVIEKEKKKKSEKFREIIQVINKYNIGIQNNPHSKEKVCSNFSDINIENVNLSKNNILNVMVRKETAIPQLKMKTNEITINSLIKELKAFEHEDLLFLAMEVAREFIEYEDRKTIH